MINLQYLIVFVNENQNLKLAEYQIYDVNYHLIIL
jgi:hypothetical protein